MERLQKAITEAGVIKKGAEVLVTSSYGGRFKGAEGVVVGPASDKIPGVNAWVVKIMGADVGWQKEGILAIIFPKDLKLK